MFRSMAESYSGAAGAVKSTPPRRVARTLWKLIDLRTSHLRRLQPCIVFQMGKVGSTSIVKALNATGKVRAFSAHRLNPRRTKEIQARFRAGETYYRDMIFERGLYRWLATRKRRVKVITGVREPFSHSYSSFFQNIPRSTRGAVDPATATVETLKEHFLAWEELGLAVDWLDLELKNVLGLDPYAGAFDHAKGCQILKNKDFEVLVLKAESSDRQKEMAIKAFLGVGNIRLGRDNSGRSKCYGDLYKRFRSEVKIPKKMADVWLNSRYMKKFYSNEERYSAKRRFAC